MRTTGFTLTLDGPPDEIDAVLSAVGGAMQEISWHNRPAFGVGRSIAIPNFLTETHNLVGTLTIRRDIP